MHAHDRPRQGTARCESDMKNGADLAALLRSSKAGDEVEALQMFATFVARLESDNYLINKKNGCDILARSGRGLAHISPV